MDGCEQAAAYELRTRDPSPAVKVALSPRPLIRSSRFPAGRASAPVATCSRKLQQRMRYLAVLNSLVATGQPKMINEARSATLQAMD